MTTDRIYYTRHDGGITMLRNGKHSVVSNDHPCFSQILERLRRREFDKVEELMSLEKTIAKRGVSKKLPGAKVFVEKDKIFYVDSHQRRQELHGTLVERILQDLGKPSFERYGEALLRFLDNVKKNTAGKDIRQEMYEWLMSGKAPLTYDGCFLAYKHVDANYKDNYTHTMDNSVGEVVRMPQKDVDKDRNVVCSKGLHFCSLGYLDFYTKMTDGSHTMIVKVNPRHVFAIPVDHSFQKGRASEYFVVGEYKGTLDHEAFKDAFIDEDTKAAACPEVVFGGWLKPSLKNMAKSYGLLNGNGKVNVVERRGRLIPVRVANNSWVDVIGTPMNMSGVGDDVIREMSLETKSVRDAVKAAIRKAEKGFYRS